MGEAGVNHDPQLCIALPMGISFDASHVAHLEWLPGAFDVAYKSVPQSTFFCSLFLVCIFPPSVAIRGGYRSPILCISPAL